MDREYNYRMSNEEAEGTSDDTIQCVICWETVSGLNKKSLPCSHLFHEKCINEWLERSRSCPVCRSSIHGMNNFLCMVTTWIRAATWLTETLSLYIYRIFLYFLNFFFMFNQTHAEVEISGVDGQRRSVLYITHTHTTLDGSGFIRYRRTTVTRCKVE
ncbi:hypothetical protein AVEN_213442-1 [Araneus ventricosus]|uniref:RING-type domain-containing protein n=1 Tax=Araneus ventricosus TaxID=182803 RepID=A0A4Y2JXA4_ARAVE|nr:hypothetical protein AVEN_213442-1 [Araneus ventricosus]